MVKTEDCTFIGQKHDNYTLVFHYETRLSSSTMALKDPGLPFDIHIFVLLTTLNQWFIIIQ